MSAGQPARPYRADHNVTRGACPYDWASVCKHVLAALHALVETPDMVQDEPALKRRRLN